MDFFANVLEKTEILGNKNLIKDNNARHIAFGIDENFAMGMGVLMVSIVENSKHAIVFNIITDNLKEPDLQKLKEFHRKNNNILIRIFYIKEDAFSDLPTAFTWSKAMYYRFLIDKFIDDAARVLYLDVDMLCLNTFDDLFTMDMGNDVAMAVADNPEMVDLFKKRYPSFGGKKYFNSGMLLINIANWHKEKISEQCMESLLNNNFKYYDQDALNAVIYDKVLFLDSRYNCLKHMTDIDDSIKEDTVFLHLTGPIKPWQRWGQLHGLTKLWNHYKSKSLWVDEKIVEPVTYKNAKYMAKMYKMYNFRYKYFVWKFKYGLWKIQGRK